MRCFGKILVDSHLQRVPKAARGDRARVWPMWTALVTLVSSTRGLTVIEQTLHNRHRPPPGQRHVEVPARVQKAAEALRAAAFSKDIEWRRAIDSQTSCEDAVASLKLVHTIDHLRTVSAMSKTGGGFDTDTYCAPGSWEAMLDGTRAWSDAVSLAANGLGPAFALSRPAGHHATRDVAMGFGLVNFAAAAVASHLARNVSAVVSILDWDVHYGNGVADIFRDEERVRYCSLHELGGFPGTGCDESEVGPHRTLLHLPLAKGCGSEEYLSALEERALPFLLREPAPSLLLICAGYDALAADPLATMELDPEDFGESVRLIVEQFGFPVERIAVGLEGGYDLDLERGMPAAVVRTCEALCRR